MTRPRALLLGLLASGMLAACRAPLPDQAPARQLQHAGQEIPAECPASLRGQLRIAASALPLSLPEGMAVEPGSARPQELLARRLLLAASPATAAAGAKIAGSTLTITILGGNFGGWISAAEDSAGAARPARPGRTPTPRELSPNRALEVIPGQLRIAPFFTSPRLGAQTLALDVTVVPGGMPRSRTVTSLAPLWTAGGQPVAPAAAAVTLTTAQHLTAFDTVEAQVQLDVEGAAPRTFRCSYETRSTLVDHEAVLPPLWTLQLTGAGRPARWLALLAPATGPFRAVFADPASAQSFATWLRATAATRAGDYQLGLFEADRPQADSHAATPADLDITRTFHTATGAELTLLTVRRLGED